MSAPRCATCGQRIRRRVEKQPLPCTMCGKTVPWPGRGRRPQTHKECLAAREQLRAFWREEAKR